MYKTSVTKKIDIIAKYFTLPINTITALMGIPIVIYIVTRKR